VVRVIAGGVRNGRLEPGSDTVGNVGYMAQVAGALVLMAAPNGTVVFSTGPQAPPPGAQLSQAVIEVLRSTGRYGETGRLGGLLPSSCYVSGAELLDSAGNLTGYVFAATDASALQVYLIDTMSTFILSALLVLLVSSVLALVLSNRTVIPVRRLSDAAKRFAEGDYSVRVPVEGGDELATLSITFNEMANSVEATDISRRSFMGNIAHELRTPMTTIKGFIDGMLDGTIPVGQRDKYLGVVGDEVARLARLTKNMLDVSRLEAGEYTPTNTVFDIWGPIASVVLGAERRINEKGLNIGGMEHDDETPVLADEDFVHQILYNLVDNAIKFTDKGGTLTIGVTPVKGFVTVSVRNTGNGIPADAVPHVFDRFYKADRSRGLNARGAGLGLHISKVLVGLMGGRIWAESQDGWTQFHFTLPGAGRQRAQRPRKQGPEA
jgi:signal transduction histidine kinase